MGFLIDTNLWIAIERGRLTAADIHAITRQAPTYPLPVNLAEIRFGIDLMADAKHIKALAQLMKDIENGYWPVWTDRRGIMGAGGPLQKAENQFSQVVDRAMTEGPQTVTRHGKPMVVVSAVAGKEAVARRRGTAKQLLALLRSCPVDLTGIAQRDRSAPRRFDPG
jgi:prevent-host-death family protein